MFNLGFGTMSGRNEAVVCVLCNRGITVRTLQEMAFRQWTSKGYVSCRVTIPISVCPACGARNWDEAAEAIIEEAVQQEVDKLP
jgi:hypothetical protein